MIFSKKIEAAIKRTGTPGQSGSLKSPENGLYF